MIELVAEIRQQAEQHSAEFIEELQRLVMIDSGTYDKAGVDRAGELLRTLLAGIGCSIEVFPNAELGDNFTATLQGSGERRLMVVGHFDTVYPDGTTEERPFRIEGERAYGPAVIDMKGGLVLGYYAMRILRDLAPNRFAEITFVANSDEEIGSPTSRALIEETSRRMDAVLVLEPGRAAGGVLLTRKGVGMYRIDVHGRASHAGAAPRDGRSANLELAHKIIALHELNDFDSGTTVSANVMRGGTARNVIPAEASVDIDVRVSTIAEAERIDSAIRAITARSWVDGTTASVTGGLNRPPMEKSAGTEAVAEVAKQIVADLGLEFEELTSGGGSDGNFTAAIGVPTLDGLGPYGGSPHSVDEFLVVSSIPSRLALVAAILANAPKRVAI
jgi:glutamate carboxypeptidase